MIRTIWAGWQLFRSIHSSSVRWNPDGGEGTRVAGMLARMRPSRPMLFAVCWSLTACLSVSAAESLRPDEVLLVYNRRVPASVELANYYAKVRNVPADRMCPLVLQPNTDDISREQFERMIRTPIKEYLNRHQLRDKIRCLVTFHGLPVRVGEQKPWPMADSLRDKWRKEVAATLPAFDQLIGELERLGGNPFPATVPASRPAEGEYDRRVRAYFTARQAAAVRLDRMRRQGGGAEEMRRFLAVVEKAEGAARLLSFLASNPGENHAMAEKKLDAAKEMVDRELTGALDQLAGDPRSPDHDRGRQSLGRVQGLLGYLASLESDLARLDSKETAAAVDSELMLLWWRVYPRTRWVWNPLAWRNRVDPLAMNALPPVDRDEPVMIVGRLDGPTPSVVRRMIDDSIEAEKNGLAGRFYIDVRGLSSNDAMGACDQDLRDLAQLARDAGVDVTLDNRPEVFQPATCPDAALYCGWYSLRKYVDAFTFVPGAVGFHIASFEAIDLRKPNETGWCRGLLLDGVAATIGPVAEPYLHSFPRPKDFFGLLLSGRFTLGECYAYSVSLTSWMQMLLGDPLYRPFAVKPAVLIEQVFDPRIIPPEFRSAAK